MTRGHPSTARQRRGRPGCYARPASRLLAIVAVAWLVFAVPVSHFFNTAAVMVAVTVAAAGAAVAAALVFAALMSTRRPAGCGRRRRELPVPLPARHDGSAAMALAGDHRGPQAARTRC